MALGRIGVVKAEFLNIRAKRSHESAIVLVLKKGSIVNIRNEKDGWLEVENKNIIGYIRNRKKYISIESTEKIAVKIQDKEDEIKGYTERESSIIDSLNEIDYSIDSAKKKSAKYRIEIDHLTGTIKEINQSIDKLKNQILKNELYINKRLVSLYKLGWIGKINLLFSAESIHDFLNRKMVLERILSQDEKDLERLNRDREQYIESKNRLMKNKNMKQAAEEKFTDLVRVLKLEQKKKKQLLTHVQSRKSLELAALNALKKASASLDTKLQTLDDKGNNLLLPNIGTLETFINSRGNLIMPVAGEIIKRFGPHKDKKLKVVNFQSGISIKADRGEPIKSVFRGKIIFARWFKGYGNLIIIDHGQNYYTLYAHIEEIFRTEGEDVDSGDVIATVGDSGSMIGPNLHFEVRHHGKPIDPLRWFKRG